MKAPTSSVTPALLVCAAFPLFFLLAPDGIPCVLANCGAAATGTVMYLGVTLCRVCSPNTGSFEQVTLQNCSVSKTTGKCEITASVDVSIKGQCTVGWYKWCFLGDSSRCSIAAALAGPNYPYYTTISTTHGCSGDVDGDEDDEDELMSIELRPESTEGWGQPCDCTPGGSFGQPDWGIYAGAGTCDVVP